MGPYTHHKHGFIQYVKTNSYAFTVSHTCIDKSFGNARAATDDNSWIWTMGPPRRASV